MIKINSAKFFNHITNNGEQEINYYEITPHSEYQVLMKEIEVLEPWNNKLPILLNMIPRPTT
ncbi:hypothetical protein MCRO_0471 [Mycoplasma crocodyli MP145]|uniref:Uncharacterized protein n=2 Tax=Mycoplasma TaxID=2093 RepID=D5E5Q4_MYCCM|nr:hypothetical protein MCRO_0471 [Mycoplasma crocodyli MP145]